MANALRKYEAFLKLILRFVIEPQKIILFQKLYPSK